MAIIPISAVYRIVDESGDDCPPNTPGEVLVKGPVVTKGYFDNSEANAETFKDGFLYTGDIGFFRDDSLRLHIVVCSFSGGGMVIQ
jgi:long-subunit acyl-CoA synthetase (AMP-forming)